MIKARKWQSALEATAKARYTGTLWSIFFANTEAGTGADDLLTALWENGTTGIMEEADGLRAFFDDAVPPRQVIALTDRAAIVREREPTQAPLPESADCDPILIGDRFYIAPSRHKFPLPDGRLWIKIDSPIAFGTGRHETTQLCLEAMERVLQPGHAVADVGCGSGILSAAAALLQASPIWSCDIEADAVQAARHTIGTPLFIGSVDALADESVDLLLANISAKVLDRLAFDLKRVLKKNGIVIVSGFVSSNPPRCFAPLAASERNEWLCWVCEPQGIHADAAPDGLKHEEQWWI